MPVLAIVVAWEVFARYALDAPTIWAFDLSLFLFGYIAALGGANAQLCRSHIHVDILYQRVSEKNRRVFNLMSAALAIFFLLLLISISYDKFFEALEFNYRRQSEWAPPMFHFWIMLMVAGGLFVSQMLRDVINDCYFLLTGAQLVEESEQTLGV